MSETNKEVNLTSFFEYLYKSKLFFLLLTISTLFISISCLLLFFEFKDDKKYAVLSLMIENEDFNNSIKTDYLLNSKLITKSLNSVDNDNDTQFLNLDDIDIVEGQKDLSELINFLSQQNYTTLAKMIAIDPKLLSEKINDVAASNSHYRTMIIDINDTTYNKSQLRLIVSEYVKLLNQKAQKDFDLTNVGIKKIQVPDLDEMNLVTISKIDNYIDLAEKYINILRSDFSSFATEINLDVTENKLRIAKDLFRDLLTEKKDFSKTLNEKLDLDLKAINKKIDFTSDILGSLDTNFNKERLIDTSSNNISSNENVTLDTDSFDKIMGMGSKLAKAELTETYIGYLYDFNIERVDLERKISNLKVSSNASIEIESLIDQLHETMSEINLDVNNYIEQVQFVKKVEEPIKTIGSLNFVESSFFDQIRFPLLILIISSFGLSFGIVIIRGFSRNFE